MAGAEPARTGATMSERRKHTRTAVLSGAYLEIGTEKRICLVHDLSDGGAQLSVNGTRPSLGTKARLTIPDFGRFQGEIVRSWGKYLGFSFDKVQELKQLLETYISDVVAMMD
jgi:hypothetical protein